MPVDQELVARLMNRAVRGDPGARQELLILHQDELRRMIAVRMDTRLGARVDLSDVVQEVFAKAWQEFSEYLKTQPVPFYPWLRRLAWERLVKLHQRHIYAGVRSTMREQPCSGHWSDDSAMLLANRLLAPGSGPGDRLVREEMRQRVQKALKQLNQRDREILETRYLEQLTTREMSEVFAISEGAVKVRHLRALQRLRKLLAERPGEESPP